jgi:hypothetical protein
MVTRGVPTYWGQGRRRRICRKEVILPSLCKKSQNASRKESPSAFTQWTKKVGWRASMEDLSAAVLACPGVGLQNATLVWRWRRQESSCPPRPHSGRSGAACFYILPADATGRIRSDGPNSLSTHCAAGAKKISFSSSPSVHSIQESRSRRRKKKERKGNLILCKLLAIIARPMAKKSAIAPSKSLL